MNLSIGLRAIVPFSGGAQGVVVNRCATSGFGVSPCDVVVLRYVGTNGALFDSTFDVADVEKANPPPVDVPALERQLESARADNMTLRGKLIAKTTRAASRSKPKSKRK